MNRKVKTYISLFSSAGVGCFGFKKAGYECIATCELLDSRIQIQRLNKKCKYESGYISGDIVNVDIKSKIFEEISLWKNKEKIIDVDVIIATPPCQGMSTANFKKRDEKKRNSLVVDAINLIKDISPKVFIFENVRAFMSTLCTDSNNDDVLIKDAIYRTLGQFYHIDYRVINFKDYGVPSSRPRTLVVGTRKNESYMSPLNIFPFKQPVRTVRDSICDLKKLNNLDEYDDNDLLHFFRPYESYMREWIKDLKEGESAFKNKSENQPYKIVNGKRILLKSGHLGNKFRRLFWDKPAACIATRNDQLAATDTIHPEDDRVFSIRELMRLMTIPDDFLWIDKSLFKNKNVEDYRVIKKSELNIRRCIGEAVPTKILFDMAINISKMFEFNSFLKNEILSDEIINNNIYIQSFINESKHQNENGKEKGVFYTPQAVIFEILNKIDTEKCEHLRILEPSVGGGNFLLPIISKFYLCDNLEIDVVDIDGEVLENTMRLLEMYNFDNNTLTINPFIMDFIDFNMQYYNYIIGNPPYFKLNALQKREYRNKIEFDCDNIYGIFMEKIHEFADNIILVLPKSFLMLPEFDSLREKYQEYFIKSVIDFGVDAFSKVFIEIISIHFSRQRIYHTEILNMRTGETHRVNNGYIFHHKMWLIYRNENFDNFFNSLIPNYFDFFRDRQITNKMLKEQGLLRVLKSKNITEHGEIIPIEGYDKYIDDFENLTVSKYINKKCILFPNFTYNTRAAKMPQNVLVNGSIAILTPKINVENEIDLSFYSTKEFRDYYSIVKNKSKFTLNIDKNTLYYIGVKK